MPSVTAPFQHHPGESAASSRGHRILTLVLLVLGVGANLYFFGQRPDARDAFLTLGPWGWPALLLAGVMIGAIAAMPPTAVWVDRWLTALRAPSCQSRRNQTASAAIFTAAYLLHAALGGHRQLWPYVHDEFSYLIQARQFASGHLWMPAHPLAAFFDSFQLFTTPVYASAYFPGTALLYVPGIWLHLPPYATSLAIAGAIGGLLYRITAELLDGLAGWLAVLLLWSDRVFRSLSVMTMAQAPLVLFGLLGVWCWLKWRDNRSWGLHPFGGARWACGIGVFVGFAAVTRPVDALCFAMPIAMAMLCQIPIRVASSVLVSVLWVLAGAAAPLILQLILNHGITGHLFETPFRLYADRDYPGTAYGFDPLDPAAKPLSTLPQKSALYREYQPIIQRHQLAPEILDTLRYRLPLTLTQGTPAPFPLLLVLLPVALMGLTRRRAVLLASLPIFLLLYAGYAFFFSHYVLTAAAAVIAGILVAADQLRLVFPRQRRFQAVFWPLFIAVLAIAALPQWNAGASDDQFEAPLLADVNRQLAHLPELPAIVLFTYDPKRNTNEEAVYNSDAAWPDDSPVIRAHDLGVLNVTLYRYYSTRQPDRLVYRYDERTRVLTELGRVRELVAGHE